MSESTLRDALTGVVMLGWVLFAIAIAIRPRPSSEPDRKRDRSSHLAVMVQSVGFALVWGWHGDPGPSAWHGALGAWPLLIVTALLAWGAGAFAVMAVRTLGKQWSIRARILTTHRLITTGPYAVVRHPIYTATLGLLLATAVALSTPLAALIGSGFYLVGTLWRIRLEERLLRQTFGEDHRRYVERVPSLIPRWTFR